MNEASSITLTFAARFAGVPEWHELKANLGARRSESEPANQPPTEVSWLRFTNDFRLCNSWAVAAWPRRLSSDARV